MRWQDITGKVGSPEQLEAMGAVACLYNDLEYTFFGLLTLVSGDEFESSRPQFLAMRNPQRLAKFRVKLQQTTEPPHAVERLHHFANCFAICAENRNLLMHSWTLNEGSESLLILKSTRTPAGFDQLHLSTARLREVATDFWFVNMYGQSLCQFFGQTNRDILEDRHTQHMTPEEMFRLPALIAPR